VLGVDLGDCSGHRPTPQVEKVDQVPKKIPVEGEAVPTKLNVVAVRDEVAAFFRRESIVVEDIANLGLELFGGAGKNIFGVFIVIAKLGGGDALGKGSGAGLPS
jgi:hypothetical protein